MWNKSSKDTGKLNHCLILSVLLPPFLQVSSLEIEYLAFDGPKQHVPGKTTIDSLLSQSQLPGAFSFNKIYLAWETDTIIGCRRSTI